MVAIVASVGIAHFAIGTWIWANSLWSPDSSATDWVRAVVTCAWPCLALLLLWIVTLVATLWKRVWAPVLLLLGLSISVGMFWYDTAYERCQVRVDIAPMEYWESDGRECVYFTWFWYHPSRPTGN